MNVETAIDKTKAVVVELLQARALNTGADIEPRAWRTMPPPRCPYVVELAPKLPAALVPFAGSAAGLSGFEATAQISKNMRDKKDQIAATAREGAKVVAERDLEAARIEALRPPDAVRVSAIASGALSGYPLRRRGQLPCRGVSSPTGLVDLELPSSAP